MKDEVVRMHKRLAKMDKKREEILNQLVDNLCQLYKLPKSHFHDVADLEERRRGTVKAVVFMFEMLKERGIQPKGVKYDRYADALIIEVADRNLDLVKIDEDMKRIAKRIKVTNKGWFVA